LRKHTDADEFFEPPVHCWQFLHVLYIELAIFVSSAKQNNATLSSIHSDVRRQWFNVAFPRVLQKGDNYHVMAR